MRALERFGPLLGRILLSMIFLLSGAGKIMNWAGTEQQMADHGMVMVPLFHIGALVFELVGGLSLLLGVKARCGALLLIGFLIPATIIFHNFWAYTGEMQQMQMINFLKNVAILGGLLYVAAFGPGPFSLMKDRRT